SGRASRGEMLCTRGRKRCSILYIRDGYLENPKRLDRLTHYVSPARLDHIGVLRVMHHGAKNNWHRGVASRLARRVSVFNADPTGGYRHPHKPVWNDFRNFGGVCADTVKSLSVVGLLQHT